MNIYVIQNTNVPQQHTAKLVRRFFVKNQEKYVGFQDENKKEIGEKCTEQ